MKKIGFWLCTVMLCLSPMAQAQSTDSKECFYQYSTINSLLQGIYDGSLTVRDLLKHGDTGIGTFTTLDGEMVVLDGKCYQVNSNGKVYPMSRNTTTPFACVTHFDNDITVTIDKPTSLSELEKEIESLLPSKNYVAAIRINGNFSQVKTRSVPRQKPPYIALAKLIEKQSVFSLSDTQGDMVGFWCPQWLNGINVPGYHLHYVNKQRSAGGHLLDCTMISGTVTLDITPSIYLQTPLEPPFMNADLSTDRAAETKAVEK